jgi:CheY-like chemotaxis protein
MRRLLLVDDDGTGLALRKLIFEHLGHAVFTASNAEEARRVFAAERPDTVILDLRIPGAEDGLELIRDLRAARYQDLARHQDLRLQDLPLQDLRLQIIVLSGWPQDLEGRPEAAMVDEVLAKPARSSLLVERLAVG